MKKSREHDEKGLKGAVADCQPKESGERIISNQNMDIGENENDSTINKEKLSSQTDECQGDTYDELDDVSDCVLFLILCFR